MDKDSNVKCEGHGSWLSHLILDDKLMWRIDEEVPQWKEPGDLSEGTMWLESDTRKRDDV